MFSCVRQTVEYLPQLFFPLQGLNMHKTLSGPFASVDTDNGHLLMRGLSLSKLHSVGWGLRVCGDYMLSAFSEKQQYF